METNVVITDSGGWIGEMHLRNLMRSYCTDPLNAISTETLGKAQLRFRLSVAVYEPRRKNPICLESSVVWEILAGK